MQVLSPEMLALVSRADIRAAMATVLRDRKPVTVTVDDKLFTVRLVGAPHEETNA
jgi:hypothetical protein